MKEKVFITVCFLALCFQIGIAQTVKTFEVYMDRDMYEFYDHNGYFCIFSWNEADYEKYDQCTPVTFYRNVEIVLPEQEKIKNVSFRTNNCTQITDVVLPPNYGSMDGNIPYEIKDYPFKYSFKEESSATGRRVVFISFNIFAYNAITKTVSWPENLEFTIETEPLEQWEYVSWTMPSGWEVYFEDEDPYLNPEDFWNEKKIPSIIGSVWSYVNYETASEGEEKHDFFRYTVLDEPKEMNGQTYYPMVKYTTCEYTPNDEVSRVYLREEGCKIYKYFEQEGEETLLYDFAIQPYDKYFFENQHNLFKTVNGNAIKISKQEKCMTAEDGFPFRKMTVGNMTWIDGIGNVRDFLAENNTQVGTSVLNYYRSGDGRVVYKNALSDLTSYKADDCALGANAIEKTLTQRNATVHIFGSSLVCTSPNATTLEIYTMDAVKVGEARFTNGEATVTVGKVPATYLYIVTYPDGRRESGKVMMK